MTYTTLAKLAFTVCILTCPLLSPICYLYRLQAHLTQCPPTPLDPPNTHSHSHSHSHSPPPDFTRTGGIVGRGVLLDWDRWKRSQQPSASAGIDRSSTHRIPLSELLAVAAHQNVSFKQGDILFVRTGWTANWTRLPAAEKARLADMGGAPAIGVEAAEDTLRWLWETGFAAVAGDQPVSPSLFALLCSGPSFPLLTVVAR